MIMAIMAISLIPKTQLFAAADGLHHCSEKLGLGRRLDWHGQGHGPMDRIIAKIVGQDSVEFGSTKCEIWLILAIKNMVKIFLPGETRTLICTLDKS